MMKTKRFTQLAASIALAIASASTQAATINEMEPNNDIGQPQDVTPAYGMSDVKAMMGIPGAGAHSDVDFYKFTARAGEVLDIDIDNGYSPTAPLDTVIAVFGPAPEYKIKRIADVAPDIDEGSSSLRDARIDDFVADVDGEYTIGVSTVPRYFFDGGMVLGGSFFKEATAKEYDLLVGGAPVVSSVKNINIEVKPGSDDLAPINLRSRGKVPVAILGSNSFSVSNIDRDSLTFGATGDEESLHKCNKSIEDVNGDGHYDLVCHFNNQDAGFDVDSLEGIVKGTINNGSEEFKGQAFLKVLPRSAK